MDSLPQIQLLISELGPALDAEEVLQHGEDQWYVGLDEHTVVTMTYRTDTRVLVLSMDLGEPLEARRLATYEMLLAYNSLWRDHGGIRLALQEPGGEVEQLFDLSITDLNLETLTTVVSNFVATGRQWQALLNDGGVAGDQNPTPPGNFPGPELIRV